MTENVRLQRLYDFTIKICNSEDLAVGTGIVVSADGKIVTCAHVVESAISMHPREAMGQEIHVYFPQVSAAERKARIAEVVGCFPQHDDDVVLLQLKDGPAPLGPEQIALLGRAAGSEGNEFQSYGFASIGSYKSRYASGEIQGLVELDLQDTRLHSNPVQLKTEDIRPGMSGGAVLDKKRNLVVGLMTERWNPRGNIEDSNIAWATDNYVLSFDPINLPLREESLPMGPAFQPRIDLNTAITAAVPKQKYSWNNVPPSIQEWVGRADLLKSITNDWIDPEKRVSGLVGFGGEGKSSLARRWIEDLLEDKTKPQPDGIFWWGFYDRPSVDEFFEAALNYLSGGNTELACLYQSSSARVHLLAGMLHGGRYIFILDGLEGLLHQKGDQFGLLKSNDLREFLQFFAAPSHDSFCLITSRIPILDMMEYTTYQRRDVDRLSAADGRELLQMLGVKGDNETLDKVVADWEGHALTLSIIGSYIADRYNGDVSHIKDLPPPTEGEPRYKRVQSVLRRYDEHLNDEERAFLKLFSVFRTPVDKTAFDDVFRSKSKDKPTAINVPIFGLDNAAFKAMVKRLVDYRLLRYELRTGKYFTHPLIRSHYYGLLLSGGQSQATEVHKQLKEYYLAQAEDMPDNPTLDDIKPLIEAVHHACRSGAYDEAESILHMRMDQGNNFYLHLRLGAYETALIAMQEFFPEGDTSQDPLVGSPEAKSWILNEVGHCLMILGQLNQAEGFLWRAIFIDLNITKDWLNASIGCNNLSALYVYLGVLDQSAEASRQALELSIRARYKKSERTSIASLAFAEHLQGDLAASSENFKRAEALEREVAPRKQYLYSYGGIWHADHLLLVGDAAYAREVTKANLEICNGEHWIFLVSRCHRVLGDLDVNVGDHESAGMHYSEALKIARKITHRQVLIEALLARGRWYARHTKNASEAFNDLEEALSYAARGGFRIYEVDIRVALAWAHLAAGNKETAKGEALYAKQMSEGMGYYWGKKDADEVLAEIEKA